MQTIDGRVCVAMSGGVDSAAAAALLVEQGVDCVGVTLRLFCSGETGVRATACCSAESTRRAADACALLGIPHVVLDDKAAFRAAVIDPFTDSYVRGETPIPCAACNSDLKFGSLFEQAAALGATAIATGHYSRIVDGADGFPAIARSHDRRKDQTYFLWGVLRERLPRILFPVGSLTKDDTRAVARRWKLPMAEQVESQDICFVEGRDYAEVVLDELEARAEAAGLAPGALTPRPGPMLDLDGRRVGTHRGLVHYTVGQRKGLGIASLEPLYVVALDAALNAVIVGRERDLLEDRCVVRGVNWQCPELAAGEERRAAVQIRYRHQPATARLRALGGGQVEVRFDEPQRAITPGQSAVFYDGEVVLGGGVIDATPARRRVELVMTGAAETRAQR